MEFQEVMEGIGKAVDAAGVAAIVIGIVAATLIAAGALLKRRDDAGRKT